DGVGNIKAQTTPTAIDGTTDKRLNSLFRVGMNFVNDHSPTASNASDSGTVLQNIGTISGGASTFGTVNLVLVNTGSSIWNSVYPQNVWGSTYASTTTMKVNPAGTLVSLVALGVGPNNAMVGATMMSAPQYPGPASNTYYYRYVALFSV